MRVQITGKVVKSEKIKPESKMFTTQVLQIDGVRAELIPIYTPEQIKEGEVTLICNQSLSSWKDSKGDVHYSIRIIQVQETAANVNPIKRSI